MPEGDTILRTARTLRTWLEGHEITAARSAALGPRAAQLVGRTVTAVEAKAKHLLLRFDDGAVLHTHMRMTGSWHVYRVGAPWQRPERQARLVLEAGDRIAVCFNAPVVELLAASEEILHPSLRGLGPDVLAESFDLAEVRRRARAVPRDVRVGDVLLDQRVVSGIGNIWRCEALFAQRVHPATPIASVDDDALDGLVERASRMMRVSAERRPGEVGAGPGGPWVYGRTNRPCRRCGSPIRSRRQGFDARTIYWCPACQPEPS